MALAQQTQEDFSAGMFRPGSRERIPANGCYDLENVLLDDLGLPVRRGGSTYVSSAAFGTGLTFIWDGVLNGSSRTLVASPAAFGSLSGAVVTSVGTMGGAGLAYPVRVAVTPLKLYIPGSATWDGGAALGAAPISASSFATGGNRLFAASGARVSFSGIGAYDTFGATDFHDLPAGVSILGLEGTRDRVAVFTTAGVWLISGIELDLTDDFGNVQHTLDRFSRDLVLWRDSGLAGWQGGLIVPALDGVWQMSIGADSITGPAPLRRISTPIDALYQEYVRLGYLPGGATVHRGRYFLPILNTAGGVVDLLVCRLDTGAWARISGHAGTLSGVAVRSGASTSPVVLGAQRDATARVTQLKWFDADAPGSDADGTTGRFQIITRDFEMGPPQAKSFVKKLRVAAVMTDAAANDPTMEAAYSTEEPTDSTETGMTVLTGAGAEDATGAAYRTWRVNARAERIRFRLRVALPSARLAVRSVQVFSRTTGRP